MNERSGTWRGACGRTGRRVGAGVCVAALVVLAGCGTGMADLDRKVNALIEERSTALAATRTPEVTPAPQSGAELKSLRSPTQNQEMPGTTNPPAQGLSFTTADPGRDVAARLDEYAAEATGERVNEAPAGGANAGAVNAIELDLPAAFRTAQRSAREYLNAEEAYLIAAIRLLSERHLWTPRLFNDTTVQLAGNGFDGNYEHALSVINDLRVSQRLPFGGTVEAGWVAQATDQLRRRVTGGYTSSSDLVLRGNVPLLRGAGIVAREDLIQAERSLVYAAREFERFRRELLVEIANDYFDLVQTRSEVANQERQLASLRNLEASTKARVDAGRIPAFQQSIAATNVLSAVAALANLRERYILQLDQFKVRLGLAVDQPVRIAAIEFAVPEPDETPQHAASLALEYRLDLQNRRDGVDDARRGVEIARNNLLPDLNLAGQVSVPTDPTNVNTVTELSPGDLNYSVGATLGAPLDREQERLRVREATLRLQQSQRDYEQFRDNVVVNVRAALRAVDLARFQLRLAEQQVEINRRRVEEQRLKIDQVDPQTIVDSENDLLEAENRRDRAVTGLRSAVLEYLLETGTLRVAGDGTFEPLPGMTDGGASAR